MKASLLGSKEFSAGLYPFYPQDTRKVYFSSLVSNQSGKIKLVFMNSSLKSPVASILLPFLFDTSRKQTSRIVAEGKTSAIHYCGAFKLVQDKA